MDILELAKLQMASLPQGPYTGGLKSVLAHIEAAQRHLVRGNEEPDETAFTDAIYRTNQAFEGSIKEAYRVLAGRDPQQTTPHKIEQYLQSKAVFRPRVLDQFKNYRTGWRNPSIHDYSLNFDADEAFLAIVSVSAFAKLAIDQIAEQVASDKVTTELKSGAISLPAEATKSVHLHSIVGSVFLSFANNYLNHSPSAAIQNEAQLIGSLSAFLEAALPSTASIQVEHVFEQPLRGRADFLITQGQERLVVEIKRVATPKVVSTGVSQVIKYLNATEIERGMVFALGIAGEKHVPVEIETDDGKIVTVISTDKALAGGVFYDT